jgi:lysosomal-associated transmembrane protein
MLGHAVVLSALAVALLHPDLSESVMPSNTVLLSSTLTPVLSGGLPNDHQNSLLYYSRTIDHDSLVVGILLTIAMMSICGGLIYGTIKGQPKHLAPFLCIQIFDACVTCITMISHLSSAQELRKWIEAQKYFSCKQTILDLDDDHLMLWALIVFVFIMFVKMYFISVVWACYNYLKNELHLTPVVRRYEIQMASLPDDTEMLLPPKYEDVVLVPVVPVDQTAMVPMPPAYTEH